MAGTIGRSAGTVGFSPSGRLRSCFRRRAARRSSDRRTAAGADALPASERAVHHLLELPHDRRSAGRALPAGTRARHEDNTSIFDRAWTTEPVEIYVLDDRNAFAHFLKFYYPELPPRRAFFLAQGSQRVVYTYSSPRLEEDLRHEATHALLRGSFGDLPLWLDEGLAEYFETDLAQPGAEHERVDHFADDLAGGWSPSLPRLESLTDIRQMTPRDYREAWAWVHLFLNGSRSEKTILLTSLAAVNEPPAKRRLDGKGATNERLISHIKNMQSRYNATPPVEADHSIRMQDKAAETSTTNPAMRGFWRRLRTWIGF